MKATLRSRVIALAGRFGITVVSFARTMVVGAAFAGFPNLGWSQSGTVIAWGDNRIGQASVPPGLSNVVAISAGEWHSVALKADGTVVAWGADHGVPSDLTNVVVIAAAGFHNLALTADGTVRAWGQNDHGQCNVPPDLTNVVALTGGWTHSLALKADGTVVGWGRNSEGQATPPGGLANVVAIDSGEYHNLALKADGTVVAWGWNGVGQTDVPPGLTNIVAIDASGLHSLALKADGTIVGWGFNDVGQITIPAGLSDVVALGGGLEHNLALKADGTVVGWGSNAAWANGECQYIGNTNCVREPVGQIDIPPGLNNVMAIAAGNFHSLALKADGASSTSILLSKPTLVNGTFNVAAHTRSGRVYVLEYCNSLSNSNWTALPLVPGTGAERTFTDATPGAGERYYRIRKW